MFHIHPWLEWTRCILLPHGLRNQEVHTGSRQSRVAPNTVSTAQQGGHIRPCWSYFLELYLSSIACTIVLQGVPQKIVRMKTQGNIVCSHPHKYFLGHPIVITCSTYYTEGCFRKKNTFTTKSLGTKTQFSEATYYVCTLLGLTRREQQCKVPEFCVPFNFQNYKLKPAC